MTGETPIDPKTLKTVESKLVRKFRELTRSLKQHDRETSELLPADSEEAAAVLDEIELTEIEEKHETEELRLVREAIQRLRAGQFGTCLACGRSIAAERLLAVPYAANCVGCQERAERSK